MRLWRKSIGLVAAALVTVSGTALAQELKLPRPSPNASVSQTIGLTDVKITYSRPGVKGRTIWGGLVPYDKVWRTGANEATRFEVSGDVTINGQPLPAGFYSLHTIPNPDEWTIIFNKEAEQWGSYGYDESKNALKIKVKPEKAPFMERMQFSIPEVTPSSAVVELRWENLRVPFTVEAPTMEQSLKNARAAVAGLNNWEIPYRAAVYSYEFKAGNKEEAAKWIDRSIAAKETFWNLRLKASMLADAGKYKQAVPVAEKAVKIGKENKDEPGEVAKVEKEIAEWKKK